MKFLYNVCAHWIEFYRIIIITYFNTFGRRHRWYKSTRKLKLIKSWTLSTLSLYVVLLTGHRISTNIRPRN